MDWVRLSGAFALYFSVSIVGSSISSTGQAYGQPSVTDPEIYVVDSRETPGRIIEIRPDARDAPRPVTYSRPDSDPAITAIASYRQSEVYFVPANSRKIMKTDGLEKRLIYEHSTYVRDIAFDSAGNLFFSEARGAGGDGRIYLLGYLGANGDAGPPWRTIDLGQIGGFWSGNFAFDPSNKLYISTGNQIPAAIYEHGTGGFERRYSFNEPITGFAFQHARRLLFTNHGQSVYALQDFSVRSTVFSDSRAGRLSDVAIVTDYAGEPCSISGRLHGGRDYWTLTHVVAGGPNVFWRYPSSTAARVASDGTYTLTGLPAGDYWLIADVRADIGRGFRPQPLAVVCPAGGRRANQDFRFE